MPTKQQVSEDRLTHLEKCYGNYSPHILVSLPAHTIQELVSTIRHLQAERDAALAELKASVEHHDRYRDAIDKALYEPRDSVEWILHDHLGAIAKLRARVRLLETGEYCSRCGIDHKECICKEQP